MSEVRKLIICFAIGLALMASNAIAVTDDDFGSLIPVEGHVNCAFYDIIKEPSSPAQWTGRCENGFVQGKGAITYDTETGKVRMDGAFNDGVMNGSGQLTVWMEHRGKLREAIVKGNFDKGWQAPSSLDTCDLP